MEVDIKYPKSHVDQIAIVVLIYEGEINSSNVLSLISNFDDFSFTTILELFTKAIFFIIASASSCLPCKINHLGDSSTNKNVGTLIIVTGNAAAKTSHFHPYEGSINHPKPTTKTSPSMAKPDINIVLDLYLDGKFSIKRSYEIA